MELAASRRPLASRSLRQLRQDLGFSRERMARLLDVSAKTIERWEDRDVLPPQRSTLERLTKLQAIVDLGLQIYSLEALRLFLTLPMPVFGGRTPTQLIELGELDQVYGELVSDYEGGGY